MRALLKLLSAASLVAALGAVPQIVQAGGVLRLDEVAVGELDPAKASDYADSILMFNVYDTLVIPQQGAPGHDPASGRELVWRRDELHLHPAR